MIFSSLARCESTGGVVAARRGERVCCAGSWTAASAMVQAIASHRRDGVTGMGMSQSYLKGVAFIHRQLTRGASQGGLVASCLVGEFFNRKRIFACPNHIG